MLARTANAYLAVALRFADQRTTIESAYIATAGLLRHCQWEVDSILNVCMVLVSVAMPTIRRAPQRKLRITVGQNEMELSFRSIQKLSGAVLGLLQTRSAESALPFDRRFVQLSRLQSLLRQLVLSPCYES